MQRLKTTSHDQVSVIKTYGKKKIAQIPQKKLVRIKKRNESGNYSANNLTFDASLEDSFDRLINNNKTSHPNNVDEKKKKHSISKNKNEDKLNGSRVLQSILPIPATVRKSSILNRSTSKHGAKLKNKSLTESQTFFDSFISLKKQKKKVKVKPCYVVLRRCDVRTKMKDKLSKRVPTSPEKSWASNSQSPTKHQSSPTKDPNESMELSLKQKLIQHLSPRVLIESPRSFDESFINASLVKRNLWTSVLVSPSMASSTPINKKKTDPVLGRSRSSLKQSFVASSSQGEPSRLEQSELDTSEKRNYFEALGLSQRPSDGRSMTSIPIDVIRTLESFKDFETSLNGDCTDERLKSPQKKAGVLCNPKTRSPLKNVKVVLTVLEDLKENRGRKMKGSIEEERRGGRKKSESGLEEKLRDLEEGLEESRRRSPRRNGSMRKESKADDSMNELRVVLQKLPLNVNVRKRKTVMWNQEETTVKRMRSALDEGEDRLVLKPGKQWRRSLSMLHDVQMGFDMDEGVIKGGKWKSSLSDIVQMQRSPRKEGSKSMAKRQSRMSTLDKRISCCVVLETKESPKREFENDPVFLNAFGIQTVLNQSYVESISEEVQNENAKKCILSRANQKKFEHFSSLYTRDHLKTVEKIGEGLYGEVFSYMKKDQTILMKIIPVEGDILVNNEPQKRFQEIITEVVILQELDKLSENHYNHTPCFTSVNKIRCARGKYHKNLVDAWEEFDERKSSENDHPSCFTPDQRYLIIEMKHGGQELESYVFVDAKAAYYAFLQLVFSIAVAESDMEFEHRDLHLGNVLVKETELGMIRFCIDGKPVKLPTNGVQVTIIDNTLSRCRYGPVIIYNDLEKDPTLFESEGSEQFEVYRQMRKCTKNDWRKFTPYTNILWLQFILFELIERGKYKNENTNDHKEFIFKLKKLHESIAEYESAFQFAKTCPGLSSSSVSPKKSVVLRSEVELKN